MAPPQPRVVAQVKAGRRLHGGIPAASPPVSAAGQAGRIYANQEQGAIGNVAIGLEKVLRLFRPAVLRLLNEALKQVPKLGDQIGDGEYLPHTHVAGEQRSEIVQGGDACALAVDVERFEQEEVEQALQLDAFELRDVLVEAIEEGIDLTRKGAVDDVAALMRRRGVLEPLNGCLYARHAFSPSQPCAASP